MKVHDIHIRNYGESFSVSAFVGEDSTDLTAFATYDFVAWSRDELMAMVKDMLENGVE